MLTQRERVRDAHMHIKIYNIDIFYPKPPKGLVKKTRWGPEVIRNH